MKLLIAGTLLALTLAACSTGGSEEDGTEPARAATVAPDTTLEAQELERLGQIIGTGFAALVTDPAKEENRE